MFSPDVIAVLDVEGHPRESWIVSSEGDRGLDFALEVIVSGHRKKDLEKNPIRYARLGIREYFVFDVPRCILKGYRLAGAGDSYERLIPQGGFFRSAVLDLDLALEHGRLRFSIAGAAVPEMEELVSKLETLVDDAQSRQVELEARTEELQAALEREQRKRDEEQRKREEEQRKREEVEAELAAARSEIDRLKRGF